MSDKTISICNSCEKRTDDRIAEKGWVRINGGEIIVHKGRNEHGSAITGWKSLGGGYGSFSVDFCCPACLINYLGQL